MYWGPELLTFQLSDLLTLKLVQRTSSSQAGSAIGAMVGEEPFYHGPELVGPWSRMHYFLGGKGMG